MRQVISSIAACGKRFLCDEKGTTAVEFGLVSLAFVTMIFGVFETGRYFYTVNALQFSVEQATRYAVVTENVTEAELEDYIAEDVPTIFINQEDLTLDVSFSTVSSIDFVELTGQYRYTLWAPFVPDSLTDTVIAVGSRMVVQ